MHRLPSAVAAIMAACIAMLPASCGSEKTQSTSPVGESGPKLTEPARSAVVEAVVYRSPAEFFANTPTVALPKPGNEGVPERAACAKWLKVHTQNATVEWTERISVINFRQNTGSDLVSAMIGSTALEASGYKSDVFDRGRDFGLLFGGKIEVSGVPLIVLLDSKIPGIPGRRRVLSFDGLSASGAAQLRELREKTVTFKARVLSASVISIDSGIELNPIAVLEMNGDKRKTTHRGVVVQLTVGELRIDDKDFTAIK